MSSVSEHLFALTKALKALEEGNHVNEAAEWVAVDNINTAIHEARKIFERTEYMNSGKPE